MGQHSIVLSADFLHRVTVCADLFMSCSRGNSTCLLCYGVIVYCLLPPRRVYSFWYATVYVCMWSYDLVLPAWCILSGQFISLGHIVWYIKSVLLFIVVIWSLSFSSSSTLKVVLDLVNVAVPVREWWYVAIRDFVIVNVCYFVTSCSFSRLSFVSIQRYRICVCVSPHLYLCVRCISVYRFCSVWNKRVKHYPSDPWAGLLVRV